MRTIPILILTCMLLVTSSPSTAEDDYTAFAKSLLARDYDPRLPRQPIEQWLKSILPSDIVAEWGEYITDCGEQTGDPGIDKDRDIPLCAEIELNEKGKIVGSLLLFVGTHNKGKLKKEAGLFSGSIERRHKTIWLRQLGDLDKIKWYE